jgi:hypothetical protein
MASQGPRIVGTGASVSTGNTPWTSPGNITANDGVFAVAALAQGSPGPSSATSNDLQGTNCGFSIPAGSTINGIQVDIFEKRDNAGGALFGSVADASVKIIKGGTKQGTDHGGLSGNTNWQNAGSLFTYGGSTDLWGLTWTAADINASNFGCSLSAVDNTGLGINALVDYMQITVFYTPPAPTVTGCTPTNGPAPGGNAVTVNGANFVATPTSVTFGGTAATNIVFSSSTAVTCTAPAHAAGTVNVTVTNPDGQQGTGNNVYTFNPAPTVTGCSPGGGALAGGTSVTVSGNNFVATPTVTFGGVAATSVVFVNSNTVTCVTPAHAAGTVNVTVTNPDNQSGTGTNLYSYNPAPTVTGCTPAAGATAGGTNVTVNGSNFLATPSSITFGGSPATSIAFVNSGAVTCVTPAHAAGAVNVVVTNPDNQTGTGANVYTFNPAPTFGSCNPGNGPAAGGTNVTISGTNFAGTTGVTFGGVAATNVVLVNSSTITCTTPVHSSVTVNVVVTDSDGQTATGVNAFLYIGASSRFLSF